MYYWLCLIEVLLKIIRSVNHRSISNWQWYVLELEWNHIIEHFCCLCYVVLMVFRSNEIENVWPIVYFSVYWLFEKVGRWNVDFWCFFASNFFLKFGIRVELEIINSFFDFLWRQKSLYILNIPIDLLFIVTILLLRRNCIFLLTYCSNYLLEFVKLFFVRLHFILIFFKLKFLWKLFQFLLKPQFIQLPFEQIN